MSTSSPTSDTFPISDLTLSDTTRRSTTLVNDSKNLIDYFHRDIISFISIARFHKAHLLPITWNSNLNSLGSGATGEIKQLFINLQTSYAFKVFRSGNKDSMFRELISEVMLLKLPQIRLHPNIIDLEGITFELGEDSKEIWPVLVFKKAQFGSLRSFINSHGGNGISLQKRIRLCSEIGFAIKAMHEIDVIHGDIKPDNILVFGDTIDDPTAKVTDFGYSCLGARDQDHVYLPVSRDWCAPEWHPRGIKLELAKKMDIYSFGLVCLWVVFGNDFTSLRAKFKGPGDSKELRLSAMSLAQKVEGVGDDLLKFFDLALCEDWEFRTMDLRLLGQEMYIPHPNSVSRRRTIADFGVSAEDIQDPGKLKVLMKDIFHTLHLTGEESRLMQDHLDPTKFTAAQKTEKYINLVLEGLTDRFAVQSYEYELDTRAILTHSCFNVSEVMYQMSWLDYRVRKQLAVSLENRAKEGTCEPCAKQAAFQVAFCYSIGYGVAADSNAVEYWLQKCSTNKSVLEAHLDQIRRMVPGDLYHGGLSQFTTSSFALSVSLQAMYRSEEALLGAKAHCTREINDCENSLGEDHFMLLEMMHVLFGILQTLGKLKEADDLGWRILDRSQRVLGRSHMFTAMFEMILAESCRINDNWDKAEELALHARSSIVNEVEPGHPLITEANNVLSDIYTTTGRPEKAEAIQEQLSSDFERVYGPDAVRQLAEMGNHGWREMKNGNFDLAEVMLSKAQQGLETALGLSHELTMMCTRNHALNYRNQNEYFKAERMQVDLRTRVEQVLGAEHPETLNVMYDLGRTYQMQGNSAKAVDIMVIVKDRRKRVLGPNHARTRDVFNRLLEIYEGEGREKERGEVLEEIEGIRQETLGLSSEETLWALRDVGISYLMQGRLTEAEAKMTTLTSLSQQFLGPEHQETLGSMSKLGELYRRQGRLKEAEEIWLKSQATMVSALGPEHPYTQSTTQHLIQLYWSQGRQLEVIEFLISSNGDPRTALTGGQDGSGASGQSEEEILQVAIAMSLGLGVEDNETEEEAMLRHALELSLEDNDT